jgi:filamentous hemagglutinin
MTFIANNGPYLLQRYGISVGYGNMSGSISASKSNVDSSFNSVTQQSGIKTGDGGFQVNVAGNTDLKGAVIASTDNAVTFGNNTFTTGGALTTSDIQNTASYSGKSTGISVGTGYSGGNASLNGAGVGLGKDQGSASTTTTSGISGIAANTAVRSTDPETGIARIFDADKVQREINAQMVITQAFSKEAPKAVASFAAKQGKDLKEQAKAEQGAGKKAALLAEAAKWDEGGTYRIALHTAAGALGGGASGAAGAAASASAANLMNELQDSIQQGLQTAGLSAGSAKAIAQGIAGLTAAGVGAAVGGAQGAATAATTDMNNRQLHPTEEQWLKTKAKDFAKQKGISEKEATERLTQQALKEVDYLWRAQLADGDDISAKAFLSASNQTFINDLGEQQKLFTTTGQQLFRPEMFADTANPAFYKQFAQSGITRSLTTGLAKELQDSGIDLKNGAIDLAKAVKDNPGAALEGVWKAVKGLPQSVVDGFKETGTAIGEGAAVALSKDLTEKLNAIYGTDTAGAQQALLAIRITAALTGATGAAKVGANLTEATAKAVGKKLDDIATAKADAKTLADRMKEIAIHKDDDRFTSVAEKMVDAKQAGWKTADGRTWWPPENGKVPGTDRIIELNVGQRLDRFGGTNKDSSFLAGTETPIDQRALPSSTNLGIRDEYVVIRSFPVEESRSMPWFGKEGMGIQFETKLGIKMTIQELVAQGYLKKVTP